MVNPSLLPSSPVLAPVSDAIALCEFATSPELTALNLKQHCLRDIIYEGMVKCPKRVLAHAEANFAIKTVATMVKALSG